jgi:hypothetical protein
MSSSCDANPQPGPWFRLSGRGADGNGVIHVEYDYRLSSANLGCNSTQPVFEVYGWGAAISTSQ